MKTNNVLSFVITVALVATALNGKAAEKTEESSRISTEFTVKALSRYLDDNAVPTSTAGVAQTDLVISDESGLYINAWRSLGLRNRKISGNYANESRYFLGWFGEVFETVSVDAGIGYYDIYGKADDLKTCYIELSHAFKTDEGTWKPSILREQYFTKRSAGYDGGSRTFFALSYEVEVRHVTIEQKVSAMYENAFGYTKAWTYEYSATASWKLNDHVSILLPTVRYLMPTTHADGQERKLILGIGAKVSF